MLAIPQSMVTLTLMTLSDTPSDSLSDNLRYSPSCTPCCNLLLNRYPRLTVYPMPIAPIHSFDISFRFINTPFTPVSQPTTIRPSTVPVATLFLSMSPLGNASTPTLPPSSNKTTTNAHISPCKASSTLWGWVVVPPEQSPPSVW